MTVGTIEDVFPDLSLRISGLLCAKSPVLIAIDGNSGAGKTTLAARLGQAFDCNVFHMDDFFPRPEQKSEARLSQPGGNVDYERFLTEVLTSVCAGKPVEYRRYNCKVRTLLPPVVIEPKALNIIEGSYCLHPELREFYDLRIFMSAEPEEQMRRITRRNGAEQAKVFRDKWIVLENLYFDAYKVADSCDFRIKT